MTDVLPTALCTLGTLLVFGAIYAAVFALTAGPAALVCDCGKSEFISEPLERTYKLTVPCGLCGGEHLAEVDGQALLQGQGIGLSCPETGQLCCYIGEEPAVASAMETLAVQVEKDKTDTPEAFTDNVIMYEVLSELKDLAARDAISCSCGSHRYSMRVGRASVDLICGDCGGRLRLPAATDEDLDRLCCQMKLEIRGRK